MMCLVLSSHGVSHVSVGLTHLSEMDAEEGQCLWAERHLAWRFALTGIPLFLGTLFNGLRAAHCPKLADIVKLCIVQSPFFSK